MAGSLVETASGVRRATPTGSGTAASRSAGRSRTARARARARTGPLGGRPRAARLLGRRPRIAGAVHDAVVGAGEPGGEAPLDHALEALAHRPAVAEAPVAALREGRAVRRPAVEAEAAEPPAGEVRIDLPAQPACGADAAEAAHPQHPQRTLGVDRGPPARPGRRAPPSPRGRTTARGPHPPGSRRGPAATRSSSRTSRDTAAPRPAVPSSPDPARHPSEVNHAGRRARRRVREHRVVPRGVVQERRPSVRPELVGPPWWGRLTGSVRTTRAGASGDRVRRLAARSSPASSLSAPVRRTTAASFGRMPTPSERRLISRFGRSSGLVLAIWGQCSRGKSSVRPRRPRARRPSSRRAWRAERGAHGPPRPTASRRPPCSASGEDGLEHRGDRAAALGPDRGRGVCGPVDAASPRRRGVRPAPPRPAGPCGRPRSTGFTPRRPRSATPRRSFVRDGPPPPRGRGCAQRPWRAVRAQPGGRQGPAQGRRPSSTATATMTARPTASHRGAIGSSPMASAVLAGLEASGVEPEAGPSALDAALEGRPPALVDLGAEPAHPALGRAPASDGARRRSPAARVETPRRQACPG